LQRTRRARAANSVTFAAVRARSAAVLAVVAFAACGSDDERENTLRPPAPINVTAAIDDQRVRVSPRSFGAGPVVFVISNQSGAPQELTLETDELGGDSGGIQRSSGPIAARSTATLKVDVGEGTYRLATAGDGIRPAALEVSTARRTSQNDLLLP
jgi:hypothetical protein